MVQQLPVPHHLISHLLLLPLQTKAAHWTTATPVKATMSDREGEAEPCQKKARCTCTGKRTSDNMGFVIHFASETAIHNLLQLLGLVRQKGPGFVNGIPISQAGANAQVSSVSFWQFIEILSGMTQANLVCNLDGSRQPGPL